MRRLLAQPTTFWSAVRRGLLLPAIVALAVLPGYVLAQVKDDGLLTFEHPSKTPEQRRKEAREAAREARINRLVQMHDCWTFNGPAGVIPGHAVVTINGRVRYVGGERASRALDRALSGKNPPHALCR